MNVITSVTTTTSVDVREYLTAARTYYVRTDGSDATASSAMVRLE